MSSRSRVTSADQHDQADQAPEAEIEERPRADDVGDADRLLVRGRGRAAGGRGLGGVGVVVAERRVGDQPLRLAELLHHAVAGVDAEARR